MIADPALEFWLRHVAADGGLWEPAWDSAYVVLPGQLHDAYRLPEELRVTADPDVAREEGATLLTAGHPILAEAADRVLVAGDAGYLVLDRPAAVPPGRDVLQAEVREAFPADHGRIDLSGEPAFVLHPVVRGGRAGHLRAVSRGPLPGGGGTLGRCPSRRELPAALARSLSKGPCTERTAVPPAENLLPAIGHAHRLMDSAAVSRRAVLAAEVSGGFEAERGRAAAYYADTIAGIERRLAAARPDRTAVLRERLRATREPPKPPTAAAAKPAAGKPAPAAGKPAPVKSPAPAKPAVTKPLAIPPAAASKPSQRRAVPPNVRGPQQKARPALAERVWSAVASGDRRTLARVVHPDSPAAVLTRVRPGRLHRHHRHACP